LQTTPTIGRRFPRRGEIYWVDLEPAQGGETKKKRPALVVSNDVGNEYSSVVIVAPITSKVLRIYPFEVETVVGGKRAKIMLNQCRAVDKSRFLGMVGVIDDDVLEAVEEALRIVFALN
jgi:mRNA interferase MazF